MTISEIKEEVFKQCEVMYEAGILESEAINGGNPKEMNEANAMFKEAHDNIICLLHDYYDLIHIENCKEFL